MIKSKKHVFIFLISIVFILILLTIMLIHKPNISASQKFAQEFLTNYYTGQYQPQIPDNSKYLSSTTELGVIEGDPVTVSDDVASLFTEDCLQYMLSHTKFIEMKDNTKDSLKSLSLQYTETKENNDYYDYKATVFIYNQTITVNGQLTVTKVNNTYKISREWH